MPFAVMSWLITGFTRWRTEAITGVLWYGLGRWRAGGSDAVSPDP